MNEISKKTVREMIKKHEMSHLIASSIEKLKLNQGEDLEAQNLNLSFREIPLEDDYLETISMASPIPTEEISDYFK